MSYILNSSNCHTMAAYTQVHFLSKIFDTFKTDFHYDQLKTRKIKKANI